MCRLDRPRIGPLVEAAVDSTQGGVTSSQDAMVSIILLPVPYLVFMLSVARSVDGASRVSPTVDGMSQVARGMSNE
jgi:hypothetical protein